MKYLLFALCVSLFFTPCSAQNTIFYGMTSAGGFYNSGYGAVYGTIFSFNPANDSEKVVWNFGGETDGADPSGDLVFDAANKLFYGMTNGGGTNGSYGEGVIFSFNPANESEKVLWNFGSGKDGKYPEGSLVFDAENGLFYGMTNGGGIYDTTNGIVEGGGTIFSFNPSSDSEKVVWNFGSGTDGQNPYGDLVFDAGNGLFYGMTSTGGTNSNGVIFSFNPANNLESVVWNFGNGTDGAQPRGDLVFDSGNGLFYGMTSRGGTNGEGAIFSFNPANNSEKVVWNFGIGTDGYYPYGDLVFDSGNGLFYGTTYTGGTNGEGAIFSFNPANNSESVVWNFANGIDADGVEPYGSLVFDADNGLFYGMTSYGGTNNDGVIFSFNPANPAGVSESVVWNFGSGTDGEVPYGSLTLYPSTGTGIETVNQSLAEITVYPNPSTGNVYFKGVQTGNTLQIYNVLGEIINISTVDGDNYVINLSGKAKGMYFYRVIDNSIATQQGKIILQ